MLELALPTLIVLLIAAYAPPHDVARPWPSFVLAAGFLLILGRYLAWRLVVTVLPASDWSLNSIVVWSIFFVEMLAWAEMTVLILVILRQTDRSAQADEYEHKFAALPHEKHPKIDVFIATYNEPLEVLEKSIAGALALTWPRDKLNICVLDDGRREWLREYCAERGVVHLTRDNNHNAKAGNINAALKRTDGDYILVLDADFVPKSRMLVRAVGFFEDPCVGIVQMPHHFFNGDPIQTSLNVQGDLPDEQRFFFDVIQPGRDGWNCAFCCGSNGIIRRSALETIGGQMPTQSITEDMLLTMTLMRQGFITRYLNEQLAIGLAPENLQAYFIQRARWAQGAIQIMFLKLGPFGPGLPAVARPLFVPSHWITQVICQPVAISMPAFYLLTGIPPIINAQLQDIFLYQLPSVVAGIGLMKLLAPHKFMALSATAQSALQAFRILPVVASTLVNPNGHVFKVTPKGAEARIGEADRFTIWTASALLALTGIGLLANANFSSRIVPDAALPMVAFWGVVNMIVLLIVIAMAVPRWTPRAEERFFIEEPCAVLIEDGVLPGETVEMSANGARLRIDSLGARVPKKSAWIGVALPEIGVVPAIVRRENPAYAGDLPTIGVEFILDSGEQRDRLIQTLFVYDAKPTSQISTSRVPVALRMLAQILKPNERTAAERTQLSTELKEGEIPLWLLERMQAPRIGWESQYTRSAAFDDGVLQEDTPAAPKKYA